MPEPVVVLFFATAREASGCRRLERAIDPHGVSLTEFVEELGREFPRLPIVLRSSRLVVNGEYVTGRRARLAPGDELAIHPPYSGG